MGDSFRPLVAMARAASKDHLSIEPKDLRADRLDTYGWLAIVDGSGSGSWWLIIYNNRVITSNIKQL